MRRRDPKPMDTSGWKAVGRMELAIASLGAIEMTDPQQQALPLPTPTHWWLRHDGLDRDAVSKHGPGAAYYGSGWREVMPVYTAEEMHAAIAASVARAIAASAPSREAPENRYPPYGPQDDGEPDPWSATEFPDLTDEERAAAAGGGAREQLRTFVDAAAGEGLVLGGVDAANLFMALFQREYADAGAAEDPKIAPGMAMDSGEFISAERLNAETLALRGMSATTSNEEARNG